MTEFRRSIADIMIQQNHLDCTKDKVDKVDLNSEDSLFPLIPLKIASKDAKKLFFSISKILFGLCSDIIQK